MTSSQRYFVMDTETTGLDPKTGDRLTELAGVEMIGNVITGRFYQQYINPLREVSLAAQDITGYTWEMLKNYPTFPEVIDDFFAFIGDAKLVIHNAQFDMKFINFQLQDIGRPPITSDRIIDTLLMARKKYPGRPNNLDALCKRFEISLDKRDKHGALVDSELLALVFIELTGGKQRTLELKQKEQVIEELLEKNFPYRSFSINDTEKNRHKDFMDQYFKKHYWMMEE